MDIQSFLNSQYANNSILMYLYALGVFIVLFIFLLIIQKKSGNKTLIQKTLKRLRIEFIFAITLYTASGLLVLHNTLTSVIFVIFGICTTRQIATYLSFTIAHFGEKYTKESGGTDVTKIISTGLNIIIWGFAILLILSNIGVNINSLIAGLGIGGIAIALAVQNILGDLFSFLTIHFDKPFKEGDLVKIGGTLGTVKKIGIRSTRIKAVSGEEIIISNKEVMSAQITNYKHTNTRKITFTFGVDSETPTATLREIPEMMKLIINDIANITFERCHFVSMNEKSCTFESVYAVSHTDFENYLDANQEILFSLRDKCSTKGITLTPPTEHIFVDKIK